MNLIRHRLRVACDNANPSVLLNKASGLRLRIYRARAFQIELAFFYGAVLQSIDQFTSITAEIKAVTNGVVNVNDAPLASATVAAVDLNPNLGDDEWANDLNQHALIPFEVADTGFDMTGATNNEKQFGLIITGITTDAVVKRLTLGHALITVVNDGGVTSANLPAAGDPLYLTADETKALLGSYCQIITDPGGSVTFMNAAGYGVKVYASAGPNPELREEIVYPPLP